METAEIEALLLAHIPNAQVSVEGEGSHFQATVVSEVFAEMNRVKRQQHVYAALSKAIAQGDIHALTIRAYTPDERSGLTAK